MTMMFTHTGPKTKASDKVHHMKYRGLNEDFREMCNRNAAGLQDNHEHYMAYRQILLQQRFLPGGRIQAAIGSLKNVTAYNCFVMPTFHDSFTDGPTAEEIAAIPLGQHAPVSIADMGKLAAMTMRQGGGVGYDFSTLRPSGDIIRGVDSNTDGPMAFAGIFDAYCKATSSAGNRRGAQMMIMRCDHPDIEQFIRAKHVFDDSIPWEMRPLRGFNMSIAVTDELMECVFGGKPFKLKFEGRVYREVDAQALWDMIMRSTYDFAEPGVIFIDQINRMNNLWYCETIAATNPCGEQPLPPYGACLLGSINLVRYLSKDAEGNISIDYDQMAEDIPHIARSMDNVIDRARYPLPQQKLEAQNKRRMGLGVTSLANALEAMGCLYGDKKFLALEAEVLSFISRNLYIASSNLAAEKGSFPMYVEDKYLAGEHIKTLDSDVQELIKKQGIRNSHLTSLAPTGTISFSADNVSSAIEPVFAYEQDRTIITLDGPEQFKVEDFGSRFLGVKGKRSKDVTAQEHVDVLITAQKYVDSAVSKTCNVPSDYPYNDFKDIYVQVFEGGGKGCTTYRPAGKYDEPLKAADNDSAPAAEACGWNPETGQRTGACAD